MISESSRVETKEGWDLSRFSMMMFFSTMTYRADSFKI
jgi:hypothetical protein